MIKTLAYESNNDTSLYHGVRFLVFIRVVALGKLFRMQKQSNYFTNYFSSLISNADLKIVLDVQNHGLILSDTSPIAFGFLSIKQLVL